MTHYKGASTEGTRAINLMKKRQKEQEELEHRKKKIEEDLKIGAISNKFAAHYDSVEQQLKDDTVGLVTLTEMKAKQEDVIQASLNEMAKKGKKNKKVEVEIEDGRRKKSKKKKKEVLSFNMDEFDDEAEAEGEPRSEAKTEAGAESEAKSEAGTESEAKSEVDIEVDVEAEIEVDVDKDEKKEERSVDWFTEAEGAIKMKRFGKNPDVDTSYLPDREREMEDNRLRQKLRMEWQEKQERIKNEEIDITYSYWDGSGHRRQVRMRKGNSMQQFLQKCLENLRKEFTELKSASVDQLMYVKEDLIIPHHNTFYHFIVTKARGKSGPLFSFDVHEDVRMISDATVEKDESHAGKVCLRSWYERHKHIFPASRWEPYDPEKSWDKYTIRDKEAVKITVK